MRHLLAPRPAEFGDFEIPPEYSLGGAESEVLLDDGVIAFCDLHSTGQQAVYHVDPEFAARFDDPSEMWSEVEDRVCRIRSEPSPRARQANDILVLGRDVRLRPLSPEQVETLESDGMIYPDKNFGGRHRTLYYVDPAFEAQLLPGEDVADAIDAQLNAVPCRRDERPRSSHFAATGGSDPFGRG